MLRDFMWWTSFLRVVMLDFMSVLNACITFSLDTI